MFFPKLKTTEQVAKAVAEIYILNTIRREQGKITVKDKKILIITKA